MGVVRTVVHEVVTPPAGLAIDRTLLARARAEGVPFLHVYAWPGDVLVLGRYHASPAGAEATAVHRRLSGGRAVPGGAGFVGVSLALPHRSALESNDPSALRGEQAMNRAVRGVLEGLTLLGLDVTYPGRDLVTAAGKPVAWISLAVEADGAALFEVGLSVERDLSVLAPLADRLDPGGVVPVTLWLPDDVTSVASRRGGKAPLVAEVMQAMLEGHRRRFGWEIVLDDALASPGPGATDPVEFDLPARLDRVGQRASMLGTLRAHCRIAEDGVLAEVRFAGDVIAPKATLTVIEQALSGLPVARAPLLARVAALLERPEHFLLGAMPGDLADAIVAARRA